MGRKAIDMGANNGFEVLIDSDAFVAWVMPDDLLHEAAKQVFLRLEKERRLLVTSSAVVAETATVLSHRGGQNLARLFLERIIQTGLPIIHITEDIQHETIGFFKEQTGRGISMVDCGNAVLVKRFGIPRIFSFDGFYNRVKLPTVQ